MGNGHSNRKSYQKYHNFRFVFKNLSYSLENDKIIALNLMEIKVIHDFRVIKKKI